MQRIVRYICLTNLRAVTFIRYFTKWDCLGITRYYESEYNANRCYEKLLHVLLLHLLGDSEALEIELSTNYPAFHTRYDNTTSDKIWLVNHFKALTLYRAEWAFTNNSKLINISDYRPLIEIYAVSKPIHLLLENEERPSMPQDPFTCNYNKGLTFRIPTYKRYRIDKRQV